MNGKLDGFARDAGYADARGVFDDVEKAIAHDKTLRDNMMKEMNSMFAQMKLQLKKKADAKADSKAADDDDDASAKTVEVSDDDDAKREAKGGPPRGAPPAMTLFSQPIGLERFRRVDNPQTGSGDAAAATRIFRGDGIAATPRADIPRRLARATGTCWSRC